MSAPIFVIRLLSALPNGKREAAAEDPVEWMLFQDGEPASPVGQCTFGQIRHTLEANRLIDTARLILLLPAEDVVLTRVKIPVNQKRQRAKLVPFILEEHLNQSVSEVFFATEWLPKTSDVGVAYIARERFEQWLKLLEEQDLKPDVVFPEQYLLPSQENHCFVIFDRGRVLIRHDAWVSSVTPVAFSQEWIDKIVQGLRPLPTEDQADGQPDAQPDEELKVRLLLDRHDLEAVDKSQSCEIQLQKYAQKYREAFRQVNEIETEDPLTPMTATGETASDGIISPEDLAIGAQANIHVKRLIVAQQVTQVLASEAARLVTEHHHFQLLQFDFKGARRKRKSKYNWQIAVSLCAGLLFVQLGYMMASTYAYESAYAEMRKDNVKTFRAIFPSVQRIRGSLRRALSSQMAKNKDVGGGAEFLDLVMTTGQSLVDAKGLVIQRISFDAGQGGIKIDLQVADYPDLEKIQKSIEAQSLEVKIDGANKDKEGVKARLRIGVS